MTDIIVSWCVDCGSRFTQKEIANAFACPKCGSIGIPCAPADDVDVKINWHELRILVIWAENWAAMPRDDPRRGPIPLSHTVKAIAKRLQEQYPTRVALTLSGELAELSDKYEIEVHGNIQPDHDAKPPKVS